MKPYYEQDNITIFHGDCRDVLPSLPADAVVLSDPPYGMGWDTDCTRFSGGEKGHRKDEEGRNWGAGVRGDSEAFDPSPWVAFDRVALWGANHYAARLSVGTTLVWLKRHDHAFGSFLSDAELGWMKGGHGVYCFKDLSMNGLAAVRSHPCQKPVGLMTWCLDRLKVGPSDVVVDPYMGSGTTLLAAKLAGVRAIGVEVEERYCRVAVERLRQGVLFGAEARCP